jgi:penicillin amidase
VLSRLLIALVLLAVLLVSAGGYLYWYAKRAEPAYAGTVRLDGLTAPVTVRFGPHAVPTIEAENLTDLLYAQGYVVASERLWQMDLMRRLAGGRLAEVMGEKVLAADRFFRTIGLHAAAAHSLATIDDVDRAHLEAYAAGVNAYIADAAGRLPLEYLVAGFAPAHWTPADSLAIAEYMGWVLSFNVREELVFLRTAARVGPARAAELFPVDEGIAQAPDAGALPNYAGALPDPSSLLALVRDLGVPVPGAASNAWVVNGHRTADGSALFANDPHLAPSMPGIWYQLELAAPGLRSTGASLPGFPFVVIGHNAHLAWGFTTVTADTQDLFVERRGAEDGTVQRPGGNTEIIAVREERILVKDRDEPEVLTVRSTTHGVIINDVLGNNTGTPMDLVRSSGTDLLALRTNLDTPDRPMAAIRGLNAARTLAEARAAARQLRRASMNLMLADREGGIAWQVTGVLPERGRGSGKYPSPGWEPGYGWTGYRDPEDNPALEDPPDALIVTANQRTVPIDQAAAISHSWMAPYRAQRIRQLLDAGDALTADDMADIQRDRVSLQAQTFLRALQRIRPDLADVDPEAARIADLLLGWDTGFTPDSGPAALFVLLQPALYRALYADELGEDLAALMSVATAHYNALEETMHTGRSSYWDDIDTPRREGAVDVWATALRAAADEVDRRLPDQDEKRLDAVRQLSFPHAFVRVPLLGRLFSVGPLPVGGDSHTVNVMKSLPSAPETVTYVPTLRAVLTPGHLFSRYRTDRLSDWLAGRLQPLQWQGPRAEATTGVLRMLPSRPQDVGNQ